MILVSIIISNYNYGLFLREAIDSALNQSYPLKEVIVVDDGSVDNSVEILGEYAGRIVSIFKEENTGQASAWNTGFRESQGDIIVFLDADDYLFPKAIEEVVNAWHEKLAKIQYPLKVVNRDDKVVGVHPALMDFQRDESVLSSLLRTGRYLTSVSSGNAYNRVVIEKIFPIPEEEFPISSDGYVNTLVPLYGEILSLREPLGVYRIHGRNSWALTDRKDFRKKIQNMISHDIKRCDFLIRDSVKFGYTVSQDCLLKDHMHIKLRLVSLCLAPENSSSLGSKVSLLSIGFKAISMSPGLCFYKKLQLYLQLLIIFILPSAVMSLFLTKLIYNLI